MADKITLARDKGPDIRFAGELLAQATTYKPNAKRWTELQLYRTEAGQYVCVEIGLTRVPGEKTRRSAEVAKDEAEVREFFEYGWLAKELYRRAGIDAAEDVA